MDSIYDLNQVNVSVIHHEKLTVMLPIEFTQAEKLTISNLLYKLFYCYLLCVYNTQAYNKTKVPCNNVFHHILDDEKGCSAGHVFQSWNVMF